MKMSTRVTIITFTAFFLTAILCIGTLYVRHSTAYACSSYMITGSKTTVNYDPPGTGSAEYAELSLWYNSCTSSNFTVAKLSGVIGNAYIETRRADGAASRTGCAANGTCTGGNIYSPTLTAQACLSLGPGAGQIGDTTCTDFF